MGHDYVGIRPTPCPDAAGGEWGHEAPTLHSPWLTLLARCECLKRHAVGEREGELGADFSSLVMPRDRSVSYFAADVLGEAR